MSPARRFLDGLEERLGLRRAWRLVADEPVPGGARWWYVLGSLLAILVLVQAASGVFLAMEYAPTTGAAHESVSRLMDPEQAPWGGLVRGLHHHGATFLIVGMVLHLVQVALFGAHRRPREANWLTGLALAGVILGLGFTGYLLPWDQNAFYATRVGLNIARTVPLVGPSLADVLQGGSVMGNLTLTRFYTLHVVVLPAALAALLLLHLALFRRHGVTPVDLPREELEARCQPFWPHQALRDVVVALAAVVALTVVAVAWPAELGPKADPATPLDARPEWYFYWLFQLLHYFEPPLEWVATLLIPALLTAFLVLLPWLDRGRDRRVRSRRLPLGLLAAALAGIAVLTVQVAVTDRRADGGPDAPVETMTAAGPATTRLEAAMLYGEWCTECHGRDGRPLDELARDFRTADFRRMAAADFEALVGIVLYGGDDMPAFGDELTEEQVIAMLAQVVVPFAEAADADEGD